MQRIFIFAILLLTLLIGCKVFHCIFIVYILLNFVLWHLKKKDSNECCASQNLLQSGNLTLSKDLGKIIKYMLFWPIYTGYFVQVDSFKLFKVSKIDF